MANKAVAVAAVVLVLGVAGWLAFRPASAPPPAAPAGPPVAIGAAPLPPPPPKPPASPGPVVPAEPPLPAPVDLERCDRDLDLFGVVVDGKSAPVAGARIRTLSHPWREVAPLSTDRRYDTWEGPGTVSARDGTFVLRLRRGQSVDLIVTHPAFVPARLMHLLAGERLRVVMAEGALLEVLVKDPDGAPVPGARALLVRVVEVLQLVFEADSVTDSAGRCVFPGLTPGRLTLAVEHDRFGVPDWQFPEVGASGTKTVEVVLPRGRTVEGRVTDARTRKPIAGARVGGNWTLTRAGVTDAEGRFAYGDWTGKGFDDLHVTAEGYGRQGRKVPPEGPVDFALEPGDRITGRILGADGAPVAGARIGCVASMMTNQNQEIDSASAVSGSDGRFELKSLRHDLPHLLVVSAPGHGRGLFDVLPPPESLGVKDLGDVALAPARAIEGRVLDAAGVAVPGIGVGLAGGDDDRRRFLPQGFPPLDITYGVALACRTDDLGRFRFPDLPPGSYKLTARNEGSVIVEGYAVHLPPDRDVLDVELRPAAGGSSSLTIVLVDDAGSPVGGLKVRATVGREMVTKDSEPDGRVRFDSLGTESVSISVFEFPFDRPRRFIWPQPETVMPIGQEVVIRLRRAGEISGVVLSPEGSPMAGMLVTAPGESGRWSEAAYTKDDGTFRLSVGLGDSVTVDVPGQRRPTDPSRANMDERTPFRGRKMGIASPTQGLEIRTVAVENDRRITIRAVDLEGRPLKGLLVSLLKPGERTWPVTNEKGEFTAEGLFAEEITISVMSPGLPPGQPSPIPEGTILPAPVKVVPEGQVITMSLRKGVPFTGRVFDQDGAPAAKASVMIQTVDFIVANGTTDSSGRFKVWIAPDQKLMMAHAMLVGPTGVAGMKQLQGTDLERAMEKAELEIRLEPYKGR